MKKNKMSNIVKKVTINLPKEVSDLSKMVYQANSSLLIKQIQDKNVVVNSIHQAINRSIADKGVNISIDEINYIKRSVTDDILNDFHTLSLEDIQLCFKMGVRGELGEYYGLNTVSYYGWLKKYKNEILPQTFQEITKYLPKPEIKEPEIDYFTLDLEKAHNVCSAILLFKEESRYELNDFGNIHYNLLEKHGYFDYISEQISSSIKEDAKYQYVSDVKNKNYSLLNQGRGIQMTDVSKLMERIEHGDKDVESIIEINFKKSILKYFIINFNSIFSDLDKFKIQLTKKIKNEYGN